MINNLPNSPFTHSLLVNSKQDDTSAASDATIEGSKVRYLLGSEPGELDRTHQFLIDEGAEFSATQQIQDTYFDSEEYVLLRHGIACCHRETLGQSALILMPIDGMGVNQNLENRLIQWLDIERDLDIACIKKLPKGRCKKKLKKFADGKKLRVKFKINLLRNHYNFSSELDNCNANLDIVSIDRRSLKSTPTGSLIHNELVLSFPHTGSDVRDSLSVSLGNKLSLTLVPSTHFQRAVKLEGLWLKQLLREHNQHLLGVQSGHDLLRVILCNQLQLIHYWYSVAIEDLDPEGVHQMRVAIRYIRSTLKTFSPTLSKQDMHQWHTEFRWLGKRLGAVRDLDVFGEWLLTLERDRGSKDKTILEAYIGDVEELRRKAIQGLRTTLESDRYKGLIREFQAWLSQEKCFFLHNSLTYQSIEQLAQTLLGNAKKRMRKKLVKISPKCHPTDLHDFRIECKRLRYSVNSLQHFSGQNLGPLEIACKQLQTELGEHQDIYEHSLRIKRYALRKTNVVQNAALVFLLGGVFTDMQRENERQRVQFSKHWKNYKKGLLKLT